MDAKQLVIVIGAKDPAAPAALRAYADSAAQHGMNEGYVAGVRRLADSFEELSGCAHHAPKVPHD